MLEINEIDLAGLPFFDWRGDVVDDSHGRADDAEIHDGPRAISALNAIEKEDQSPGAAEAGIDDSSPGRPVPLFDFCVGRGRRATGGNPGGGATDGIRSSPVEMNLCRPGGLPRHVPRRGMDGQRIVHEP